MKTENVGRFGLPLVHKDTNLCAICKLIKFSQGLFQKYYFIYLILSFIAGLLYVIYGKMA